VAGLSVGYDGKPVVAGLDFALRAGEVLTLLGPNGAGKSTVLKSIAGQLAPVAGTVYLGERPLSAFSGQERARTLSVLLTDRTRPELMTCEEVVSAGRYPYTGRLGILSGEDRRKVEEAMELVHVLDLRHRDFNRISDGQRQRVLLARAICQEPQVLLLDEPTSFLDIRHKLELLSLLKELVGQRGWTVVLSLHELDLAQRVSDHLLCLRDGVAHRYGTPEEIFSGGYISQLYGVERGSYHELFGSVELEAPPGPPQVFVIGGGGAGIPLYRRLARRGIPFGAGVLHKNDLDLPVAQALAAAVVTEEAFEPIGPEALSQGEALLRRCQRVICCVERFGTMNQGNAQLLDLARQRGILLAPAETEVFLTR
jgi:iron complex transport system ATP-binding protein